MREIYFYLVDIGTEFRYESRWWVKTSHNTAQVVTERREQRFSPHTYVSATAPPRPQR